MKSLVAAVAGFSFAVIVGMPSPAAAHDGWHHRGHWYHGPRVGLFFGVGVPFFYPAPPPPVVVYRYAPPRVVYAPPRVVYASPPVHAVPTSPVYTDSLGRSCREFQTTVTIGGVQQPSYGTACLEPDGSWHIVR